MYRWIVFYVKEAEDEAWTVDQQMENLDIYYERKVIQDHKFVRMELRRKDSRRLFVWEHENGKLTHSPYQGRKNRKLEPKSVRPKIFMDMGFEIYDEQYIDYQKEE